MSRRSKAGPGPASASHPAAAAVPTRSGSSTRLAPSSWLAGGLVVLLVLGVVEAGWLVWFESQRLANANNIPRWLFLARGLPHVVPGVTFSESYLGLALAELAHPENLQQRIPIVAVAALIACAAVSLGRLVLRALKLDAALTWAERLGAAFGIGVAGLGVLTLIAGRLALLRPWSARLGLAALILTELIASAVAWRARREAPSEPKPPQGWRIGPGIGLGLLVAPFLTMMALGAMLPSIDFDGLEYHLQGPKEYYQSGRIAFLPHNVYTSMPFGIEMLHLLGMEVFDDWWWGALAGQLLIALHAPMAALMIAQVGRRAGSPRAAWFAAAVYLTTPWVYRLAVLPYVEGPLASFHAAVVWAAVRAWSAREDSLRRRFWGVAGVLAGGAMACKYPALVSAVIPLGLVALCDAVRRRSPAALLAFALGWAVIMTPWLARNVLDTGNPVYPLGYRVFGGRHWDPEMDAKWSRAHGPRPISLDLFVGSLLDVAGRSDWQSALYMALAPLALLRRDSRRFALVLWAYAAYLFLTWWLLTHRLDRFWLPLLPVLAMLAGLGADWIRATAWTVLLALMVGISTIANLSYASTALTALNEWTRDLSELRTAVPAMLDPSLAEVDRMLPPEAKILIVGQAAVFHVNHPILYNTVFDDETLEQLARDQSPEQVREALRARGVTHLYIDWYHIDRFRSPGNYGYTAWMQPAEIDRLIRQGVLELQAKTGPMRELYRVLPAGR